MKVGIIGNGQIAGIYCPLILKQPDTRIVGIADKEVLAVFESLGNGAA